MHSERYELSTESAAAINRAKAEGRRVVVIGTTAVRLLESNAASETGLQAYERSMDDPGGPLSPGRGTTDLFIGEGHEFTVVDALITNFHLPRSTLLMLVSAFAGCRLIRAAYEEAVSPSLSLLFAWRRDADPLGEVSPDHRFWQGYWHRTAAHLVVSGRRTV